MKISRRIFINRSNNQGSITLPSKILRKIQEESKLNSLPKKIFIDIIIPGKEQVKPIPLG